MILEFLTNYSFFIVLFIGVGIKVYIKRTTGLCVSRIRSVGKTVIITGGTSGIGKETALAMAYRGAKVIITSRDMMKGKDVRDEIISRTSNKNVEVHHLDFTSLDSVRTFASNIINTVPRVDILINNAGAGGLGNTQTKNNLHIGMQVNHFGPFLLTCLLLDKLKKSAPSRIIMVSSQLHHCAKFDIDNLNCEKSFSENQVYFCSKFANILVANELAEKLKGTGVTVYTVHPGFVATKVWKHLSPIFYPIAILILEYLLKNPFEAGQTSVYVAVDKHLENVTGKYYRDCQEAVPSKKTQDKALAKKLWEKSEALVGLTPEEKHF